MWQRINIIYSALFLGLLIQPHIISGHVFIFPTAYVESISTVVLFLIGYAAYSFHKNDVAIKEVEVNKLTQDIDISTTKLNDSFKYIGQVNLKLPLLNKLTTDLLKQVSLSKKGKKNTCVELLKIATVSVATVQWGELRIVNKKTKKTDQEFIIHGQKNSSLPSQISNQALLASNIESHRLCEVNGLYVFSSSDSQSNTQCFLILPKSNKLLTDESILLLQNITDQAQLFYKYIY